MDLTAIRTGIADLIETEVPNAYAYAPTAPGSFPAAWVDMPELDSPAFQQKMWDVPLEVVLAVADVWDRSAQEETDRLLVALWPLMESDQTLGGALNGSLFVDGFRPVKSTDNATWVGGVFSLKVTHTDD